MDFDQHPLLYFTTDSMKTILYLWFQELYFESVQQATSPEVNSALAV